MTPRERVLTALAGGMPDRVPMLIWNNKLPGGALDEKLLAADVCVIVKANAYTVATPGVDVQQQRFVGKDGAERVRTVFRSPAGVLETVTLPRPGTTWTRRHLFSDESDYAPLEALIRSRQYTPCPDAFARADRRYGEQSLARPMTIHSPLHYVIHVLMGVERFSVEWAERRDRVCRLVDVIAEDHRKQVEAVAASAARFAIISGNITAEVMGPERFARYELPVIEESCATLHAHGKLAGAHLDANLRLLAPLVAASSLDIIEAFTPPPDCDLPLAEARRLWPRKALVVNFPSSVHLGGPQRVCAGRGEILRAAAPGGGFVMGVIEDVPNPDSLVPLAKLVRDEGRTPLAAPEEAPRP